MPVPPTDTNAHLINPFPDVGGVYLLIAGILLGVLLGPAVFGRLAPNAYRDAFVGGADLVKQLEAEQTKTDQQLRNLEQTGVTDTAIKEQLAQREQKAVVLQAQLQQAQQQRLNALTGWAGAIMLAMLAVMLLESLLAPNTPAAGTVQIHPALGRLITARYALAALWIALVLAQPALIKQLPILFTALLVVVAIGAALMPLSKKQ